MVLCGMWISSTGIAEHESTPAPGIGLGLIGNRPRRWPVRLEMKA